MKYITAFLCLVYIAHSLPILDDAPCSFEVLSIDHSTGQVGTYFNFDVGAVDQLLGHANWQNSNFQVYNSRTQTVSKVILWRNPGGGSAGNGHGRKDDTTAKPGDFQTGDTLSIVGIVPFICKPTPECTFIVLSTDHTFGQPGQYFNFDVDTINVVLDRQDWTDATFAVYNHRTEKIIEVVLWNASNGGSVGNGHGREDDGTANPGDFEIGDAISFVGISSMCS